MLRRITRQLLSPRLLITAILTCCAVAAPVKGSKAQEATAEQLVITGEEVPSAYGAPPGISRTRFSPLLTAYVLPPGAV
ncbi:MAG TPA: hypothetical protein VFO46_10080, partial [Candidatus Sulfotelmatobacter sp.]|nr:hypothetical protein [Candidatus Sulfotelmatobacter sp.]